MGQSRNQEMDQRHVPNAWRQVERLGNGWTGSTPLFRGTRLDRRQIDVAGSPLFTSQATLAGQQAEVVLHADPQCMLQLLGATTRRRPVNPPHQSGRQRAEFREPHVPPTPQAVLVEDGRLGQGVEGAVVVVAGQIAVAAERTENAHVRGAAALPQLGHGQYVFFAQLLDRASFSGGINHDCSDMYISKVSEYSTYYNNRGVLLSTQFS